MICYPNAKINLGLEVIRKREDNFHDIETIFFPFSLSDILELRASDRVKLTLTGLDIIDNPDNNLVLKAYQLLKRIYGLPPVEFHLHKIIPTGAGLGGGSSDAAFTLKGLNDLFQLNIEKDKMIEFASTLGSDCAFFIHNHPVFAEGRGDIFTEIELGLKGLYMVLVKPSVAVSTVAAYRGVTPAMPDYHLIDSVKRPVNEWNSFIRNQFEESVFATYPIIGQIKKSLLNKGALYASMSGSGSSVYGLFDRKPENLKTHFPDCFYWEEKCS
jgi:4-diphosphocytidyl-2-C-methyl-D-erythritol kinase